jgi:hypothetical protein
MLASVKSEARTKAARENAKKGWEKRRNNNEVKLDV